MQAVQLNMFDILDPLSNFEESLLRGSGYENGKIRIYAASINLNASKFAEFLKEEYGVGGHSSKDGFVDYNTKGISIRNWKTNEQETHNCSQTAKAIKKLIGVDRYLTPDEKNKIKTIQKKHRGQLPMPVARIKYE